MTIQLKGRSKKKSHLLSCLVVALIIIGRQDVVVTMIELENHICDIFIMWGTPMGNHNHENERKNRK